MLEKLRDIVVRSDTKNGRAFDVFIQVLIVISLVTFSIETLKGKSDNFYFTLDLIEDVIVSIFTLEYVLRVFLSQKRLKFVLSFYGIIDLLSILPFYLSLGFDLRSLRIFRLIRVFKFFRYSDTINRARKALSLARKELILFFSMACIMIYLSAVGIYYFENSAQPERFSSILDSLWWAVATLTTVGYGDVYPITVGGKLFTFFILMIGLGIVSIPAGIIASAFTRADDD